MDQKTREEILQYLASREKSLVDSVISTGDNPDFAIDPEDQFRLPKQLNTITKLRKDGWDNSRIFNALELEEAEASSLKTAKQDLTPQKPKPEPVFRKAPPKERGFWSTWNESRKRGSQSANLDVQLYDSFHQIPGSLPMDELADIHQKYQELWENDPIQADTWYKYIASASGQLAGSMQEGITAGIPSATAGATGAAIAGTLSPLAAVPEEIATVPIGFGTGMAIGSTWFFARQGAGAMLRNMLDRGVDPTTSMWLANLGGFAYGMVERMQLTKLVPKTFQGKMNDLIADGLSNQIGKWTKEYGTDWATQIGQEEIQLAIEILTTEIGAGLSGKELRTWESIVDEVIETGIQTAAGLIPMQGVRGATDIGLNYGPTKMADVASAIMDTKAEFSTPKVSREEAATIESQVKQITEDKANDYNIAYNKEKDGSTELSEDEIIASGYEIDLNNIPESRIDENGKKYYAVKVRGETNSEGDISLTSAADRSTILEEVVESRLKKLQNSKNPEEQQIIDKIKIWTQAVRKKASEMGLELRFSDTDEGNVELFSDAILYGKGGFTGLSENLAKATYIPDDLADEFIGKIGEMSDGSTIFDILKSNQGGLKADSEFVSAVDLEIASQMEKTQEKIRPPPTKPTTKSKLSKPMESGTYQLEPDVVKKAVNLYPSVEADIGAGKKAERVKRFNKRIVGKDGQPIPLVKQPGRPTNKSRKFVLDNGGVLYVGYEKTPEQWLEQVNSVLTEEEQKNASQWYEEAYPTFVEVFGEAEAVNYMVAWLMGNVNASPQQAMSNMFLGAEQLKSDLASEKSAGLPLQAKNVKKILSGIQTEQGAGVKLYDFLDSALGKTTRTIMQDDPKGGSPIADDRHTNRDMGFVDSTLKNLLMKLSIDKESVKSLRIDQKATYKNIVNKKTGKFERNPDGTIKKKRSVPGPTETQYEWAVQKFNQLSAQLNELGYLGGNLQTWQHQAIGWTAIARMVGTSDGMSIPNSMSSQTPSINYALQFPENAPYNAIYGERFKNLSYDEKVKLTEKILKEVTVELVDDFGMKLLNATYGTNGFWKDYDMEPSATIQVLGSNQGINGLMDALGYLFQQESIFSQRHIDTDGNNIGIIWESEALADRDMMEMVYKILREETGDVVTPGGFGADYDGIPSLVVGTNMTVSTWDDNLDALNTAIERIGNELGIALSYKTTGVQNVSKENNWKEKPDGTEYTRRLGESFPSDLQKRLDNYYAPRIESRLEEGLRNNSEKRRKTYQLAPDPDYAAEISAAEQTDKSLDISTSGLTDHIKRVLFDKLQPVVQWQEDIQNQLLNGHRIRDHQNVVLGSELYVGKVSEMLSDFNKSIIDIDNSESFINRLNKDGISLEDFNLYLHALHAKERNNHIAEINEDMPDAGSGMSSNQAKLIKAKLHKKYGMSVLRGYAKEFKKDVIDASIDKRLEAGLITQEDYDTMKQKYKNYVPLYRILDETESVLDQENRPWYEQTLGGLKGKLSEGMSGAGSFDVKGKEFKKARGSERRVKNILVSSIEQYQQAVVRAEKNMVNKRLLSLIESYPEDGTFEIQGVQQRPIYNEDGEIDYMAEREIIKDSEGNFIEEDQVVHVKIDGKVKRIIFKGDQGKRIARAMKDLGKTRGVQFMYAVNNYLRYVNTIANPEFMIGNFIRDVQTAGIHITAEQGRAITAQALSPKALSRAWKGVYNVVQNEETDTEWGQLYERLRKAGGKTGFFDYQTIEEKLTKLEKDLTRVESKGIGIKTAGKSIFNFVENVNEATESAVRLTLFKAMLDNGYSEEQAASGAKNVTINFNRKGEWGQFLNSLYLFANAGLQGTGRIYGVVKNTKTGKVAVSTLAAMGLMEAILNNMASEDDDEYAKLSNWEKDNNFIIRYGDSDKYFKIRLPYGYNLFKVTGNIAGDVMWRTMKGEPANYWEQTTRLLEAFNSAYNPIGSGPIEQVLAPTVMDPFIQLSTNKAFHGGPIKPTSIYGPAKADVEQAWERTPEIYKNMSQWYFKKMGGHIRYNAEGGIENATRGPLDGFGDVSPETIEFWVDYLGGGLGKTMGRVISTTQGAIEYNADYTKAPFVRQLYGKFDKKSESFILYNYEKDMKRKVFDQPNYLKYLNYLEQYYIKGNMTRKEYKQRYKRFVKAQKEAIRNTLY